MVFRLGLPLISAVVIFLISGIAEACSPPHIPGCFSSIGLGSGKPDYNHCRAQIQTYQSDGNSYLRCLENDLNRAVEQASRATQNYNYKKVNYETAKNSFNQAVGELNQANAIFDRQKQAYENAVQIIQQNSNAIINTFNQMFGG